MGSTKIAGLENNLDVAKDDNAMLARRVEIASDDLEVKQTRLTKLEHEKSQALKQLETNREKSSADLESFQLREKMLDAELKRGEITMESLQDEVNAAVEQLSTSNEEHVKTAAALSTTIAGLQND